MTSRCSLIHPDGTSVQTFCLISYLDQLIKCQISLRIFHTSLVLVDFPPSLVPSPLKLSTPSGSPFSIFISHVNFYNLSLLKNLPLSHGSLSTFLGSPYTPMEMPCIKLEAGVHTRENMHVRNKHLSSFAAAS